MEFLESSLLELITQTSTNLPPDVRAAMGMTMESEQPATQSQQALQIIASNIDMALDDEAPICQDTGMPTFVVHTPVGVNQLEFKRAARAAVREATRRGKLRPNSVDSLTGSNSGDNLGEETPVFHFEQWEQDEIEVKLILKGGGCENKNIQYSVPCILDHLGRADRNLEGVRKCILHAVWQAQGQGCAPGALGVCIGSDRAHGYELAKFQLLRTLDDTNPNPVLAKLEAQIMDEANRLGVGAMGFGGKVLAHRLQDHGRQPPAGQFLRLGGLRVLGLPASGCPAGRGERRHHPMALPRPVAAGGTHGAGSGCGALGPRSGAHPAHYRSSRCAR